MGEKAFTAGVVPGGLTSNREIKILLCYLLVRFGEPAAHALLIGALTKGGLVNYFECADALGDLLEAGNIAADNGNYAVTETGKNIAETLYRSIPLTVRERALLLVKDAARLQRNQQQHRTEVKKQGNGYLVRCFINENGSEVFAVELYAPGKYYAQNIQRNFVNNGEEIVREVFGKLTADPEE